ncbi:MAG: S-DNA-T family DNA segregation ATPase FtsK/SpoIIIE, partial [Bacteroidia bacterium]
MAKKQVTKRKTKSKKSSTGFFHHLLLRDPRTRKIVGGIICLFAIFMFLAFLSFLFTWKMDDSAVSGSAEYFRNNNGATKNWMKLIGAKLAFQLMYSGFGLTAFTLPYLVAVIGLRIYTNSKTFNIYVALKYTLLIITFFSVFIGLIFHQLYPNLAGVFGYGLYQWLSSMVGAFGVILILLAYLASVLIWNFDIDLYHWFGKKVKSVR